MLMLLTLTLAMVAAPAVAMPDMERQEFEIERPGWFVDVPEVEDAPSEDASPVEQAQFEPIVQTTFLDNDTKTGIYDLLVFCMVLSVFATVIATISVAMVVRRR